MALRAISYYINVLPDPVETERELTTDTGIVIKLDLKVDEKMEQNAQTRGTILDIGEDAFAAFKPKTVHAGLKIGDKVWYAKYAGKWVKDLTNNREILVLRDEDICLKETED
jgi:co-chaperonin GroES (HSP10)